MPPPNSRARRLVQLSFVGEQCQMLSEYARKTDLPITNIVRAAVAEYLARHQAELKVTALDGGLK